jgi:hypothetical protein
MMVIEPHCAGECILDLSYGPTSETYWMRVAQIAAIITSVVFVFRRRAPL